MKNILTLLIVVVFVGSLKAQVDTSYIYGPGFGDSNVDLRLYINENNYYFLEEGKTFFRICATANYNLTGMTGGVDGRFVIVCNVCANTVQVIQDSPNSLAPNRILTGGGGTYSLAQDESSLYVYDGISQRWLITAKSP